MGGPQTLLTKGLCAYNSNDVQSRVTLRLKKEVIRPVHSFARATTAELSWHVQPVTWMNNK